MHRFKQALSRFGSPHLLWAMLPVIACSSGPPGDGGANEDACENDVCSSGGSTSQSSGASSSSGGHLDVGGGGATGGEGAGGSSLGGRSVGGGSAGSTSGGTGSRTSSGGGGETQSGIGGNGGLNHAGGSGGGGPKPSLITSAKGAYWAFGEVAASTAALPTITVEVTQPRQTWLGFGGKFSEQGYDALRALPEDERSRMLELLFHPAEGIGFTWGRLPIGADDHALAPYTHSAVPGEFDVARDEEMLIPYIQAAQAIAPRLEFWAVPWTPPVWAKVDSSVEGDGYVGGLFDVNRASDYADYLVSWIEAYESRGIPIEFIMPQNEPGMSSDYPSCAFGPALDTTNAMDLFSNEPPTLGSFVVDWLAPALAQASLNTEIWYGPFTNSATLDTYWEALVDKTRVEGVALQLGLLGSGHDLWLKQELPVMQALHWPGNAPFRLEIAPSREEADRNSFLPSQAPNNHAYAEESWDLLKEWIDAGVNLYMAGNFVLDHRGFDLGDVRPWPQNALISVNKEEGTAEVTPAYYVFRHVAQYVDVGAQVLTVDGNALAFQNPDGSFVVVARNDDETDVTHAIDIDGTRLDAVVPARGWATINHAP